jgi:PPOX class probable FMN-dependent enzyme
MNEIPWCNRLEKALESSSDDPKARFVQLATVTPDGKPANRTLVFRGFLEGSAALTFVTNAYSQKVQQLQTRPHAALCWYFTKQRQQFRITGKMAPVTADDADSELLTARQAAWSVLSESVRRQFFWPIPRGPRAEAAAFDVDVPSTEGPPESFVLLVLTPSLIDFLDIAQMPHERIIYQLQPSGTWTIEAVNP